MANADHGQLISPTLSMSKGQGRLSSFDAWPQYLFPSRWNHLASDLEVPYAFSHHLGSILWTRDDALNDIRWDIWAKLPCLNCVVHGEVRAKNCDRMRRQENNPFERCCKSCEQAGMEDSYIEMIQQRRDAYSGWKHATKEMQLRSRDESHGRRVETCINDIIWTRSEKALRKQGLVIWKPINLQVGDVKAKAEIVERFENGAADVLSHSSFTNYSRLSAGRTEDRGLECDAQATLQRRVREWDQEEYHENLGRKLGTPLNPSVTSVSPPVLISDKVSEALDATIAVNDRELEDVCEHWSYRLGQD